MYKLKQLISNKWKHWKEISVVYTIQLVLGLVVTITFYSEMSGYFEGSMVLEHLAKGFDRTAFMDLVHSQDEILPSTKLALIIILVLYLCVGVFLQAGWLANIRNKKYSVSSLLSNGLKFISPFMGIAVISILLVAIVGIGGGIIFSSIVGDPLVTFSSEKPYVIWIVVLLILLLLWSICVWSWSVSSRCHYISGHSFFGSLKRGLGSLRSNWLKFQAIGLLVVGIHVLFMFSYYWIMGDRGASNWCIVVFGIFVQQVFHYMRIILRGFGFMLIEDLV